MKLVILIPNWVGQKLSFTQAITFPLCTLEHIGTRKVLRIRAKSVKAESCIQFNVCSSIFINFHCTNNFWRNLRITGYIRYIVKCVTSDMKMFVSNQNFSNAIYLIQFQSFYLFLSHSICIFTLQPTWIKRKR